MINSGGTIDIPLKLVIEDIQHCNVSVWSWHTVRICWELYYQGAGSIDMEHWFWVVGGGVNQRVDTHFLPEGSFGCQQGGPIATSSLLSWSCFNCDIVATFMQSCWVAFWVSATLIGQHCCMHYPSGHTGCIPWHILNGQGSGCHVWQASELVPQVESWGLLGCWQGRIPLWNLWALFCQHPEFHCNWWDSATVVALRTSHSITTWAWLPACPWEPVSWATSRCWCLRCSGCHPFLHGWQLVTPLGLCNHPLRTPVISVAVLSLMVKQSFLGLASWFSNLTCLNATVISCMCSLGGVSLACTMRSLNLWLSSGHTFYGCQHGAYRSQVACCRDQWISVWRMFLSPR